MPERIRTGSSASAGRARMASSTSRPFMPGISRSSRTRSTDASGSSLSASAPEAARTTWWPARVRMSSSSSRLFSWSSITRMRPELAAAGGCSPSAVAHKAAASSAASVVPGCQGQPVDAVQELARPLDQSLQVRACGRSASSGQQLGEADDGTEGRAQVVAQRAPRGRVVRRCRCRRRASRRMTWRAETRMRFRWRRPRGCRRAWSCRCSL